MCLCFQASRRTKKQPPTSKHNSKPRIKVHQKKSTAIKHVQQILITFSLCLMPLPTWSLQTTYVAAVCIEATIAQLSCRVYWDSSAACAGCNSALAYVTDVTSCLIHCVMSRTLKWGLFSSSRGVVISNNKTTTTRKVWELFLDDFHTRFSRNIRSINSSLPSKQASKGVWESEAGLQRLLLPLQLNRGN